MTSRIVVIDDERAVVELVGKVLLREGFEVETALTGEAGLAVLEKSPVACVVVDKILPGVGGLEVLAQVHQRWPETAVVLMTGHPEPFTLEAERPEAVLDKPFKSLETIVATVREAMESLAARGRNDPLTNLKERVAAVVAEIAPNLRKRE